MGVREEGLRRIGTVTGGIVAASIAGSVGVGLIAHAQAHPASTEKSGGSTGSNSSSSSDDDSGPTGANSGPSLSNPNGGSAHAHSSGS